MSGILLALYGLYFAGVGINGNEAELYKKISQEKQFVPWLISALVLALLSENDDTKKLVAPFAGLMVVSFAVKNVDVMKTEFTKTYDFLTGKKS